MNCAASALFLILWGLGCCPVVASADAEPTPGPLPDPSARLLTSDDAVEYWTLYIELDSGHRITQRFLLTNAGPGKHTAVAVGHLIEPGRAPYRYENGRRRSRWKLSPDRLFLDISASHLDLHRPRGQLLITKDEIEIRLSFDFGKSDLSVEVPRDRLPARYAVDILAVGAATNGTIRAPWMDAPLETTGRTWVAHTWSQSGEAALLDRRVDFYAAQGESVFYGLYLRNRDQYANHFRFGRDPTGRIIESPINVKEHWKEARRAPEDRESASYPLAGNFRIEGASMGQITLSGSWLRFDPLDVIPNPFRWFIRRVTQPREVWADAEFDVTLFSTSEDPSHPPADGSKPRSPKQSASNSGITSERKSKEGSATSSMTGVASITFMNPIDRR